MSQEEVDFILDYNVIYSEFRDQQAISCTEYIQFQDAIYEDFQIENNIITTTSSPTTENLQLEIDNFLSRTTPSSFSTPSPTRYFNLTPRVPSRYNNTWDTKKLIILFGSIGAVILILSISLLMYHCKYAKTPKIQKASRPAKSIFSDAFTNVTLKSQHHATGKTYKMNPNIDILV